jgi:hypothetical protein
MLEHTPYKTAADVENALKIFIQQPKQHQNLLSNAANPAFQSEATATPLAHS